MNIEVLELALDALEIYGAQAPAVHETITALRQAIEQAQTEANERSEVEPVAKVVSTAPKQIWLDLGFDPSFEDEISFNDLCDATWSHDNATGYGIEYVRSDLACPPQCRHEQESVQIAGFDVVIDESMPPNKFKFEQAQPSRSDIKQEPVSRLLTQQEMAKAAKRYTSPPSQSSQRPMECKPLTDEEIFEVHKKVDSMQYLTFARAIEAAHGITGEKE